MFHLNNNHHKNDINDYLGSYLKNKAPDCILYSEDGAQFKTHKEVFGQTKFMRELLKSQHSMPRWFWIQLKVLLTRT